VEGGELSGPAEAGKSFIRSIYDRLVKGRSRRLATLALLCVGSLACARARSTSRVVLVGVDGADPDILGRLIAEGRLPNFTRLKTIGASGRLRSREPLLSPILWTTIATGRKAQDHGILDFVEVSSDGKLIPITSTRRRVPALWNILDHAGKSTGVVGWYATYPAEHVRGFLVSDHLGFHQVKSARAGPGSTYPENLADELRVRFGEVAAKTEVTRARFVEPGATPSPDGMRRLARLAEIHATTSASSAAQICSPCTSSSSMRVGTFSWRTPRRSGPGSYLKTSGRSRRPWIAATTIKTRCWGSFWGGLTPAP
jgi:hypothetical protein